MVYINFKEWLANDTETLKNLLQHMICIALCTVEDYLTGKALNPPRVSIRDGRHRFAAFRDAGFKKIAVGVDFEKAKALDKVCGANI